MSAVMRGCFLAAATNLCKWPQMHTQGRTDTHHWLHHGRSHARLLPGCCYMLGKAVAHEGRVGGREGEVRLVSVSDNFCKEKGGPEWAMKAMSAP
eukprot:1154375-Pelagomonas_calceolata.AAC.2